MYAFTEIKYPLYPKKIMSEISDHIGKHNEFREIIEWLGKDSFAQERQ